MRNPTQIFSLDVDAPQKVAGVLWAAANQYSESAAELESAWQDPGAGRIWSKLARILDAAARKCEAAVQKEFGR